MANFCPRCSSKYYTPGFPCGVCNFPESSAENQEEWKSLLNVLAEKRKQSKEDEYKEKRDKEKNG